jgi:hypothetical protein
MFALPDQNMATAEKLLGSAFERLLSSVLQHVLLLLPPSALSTLALKSRTLRRSILATTNPVELLSRQANEFERAKFLVQCFDSRYPD